MTKDYYEVLQISPSATVTEIKAAYRRLAHLYHPDKHPDDKYALANFNLLKEAYETLSKPSLREEYLQHRWLSKAQARGLEADAETPETILKLFLDANRKVQNMDAFRANKMAIADGILHLLREDNIRVLNDFDERAINDEIVAQALQMGSVLKPAAQKKILQQLQKIKMADSSANSILNAEKRGKQALVFDKLKPWLIALAVLLFCLLIRAAAVQS